jgi:transcriptional regulator with XRE-family HTH domain
MTGTLSERAATEVRAEMGRQRMTQSALGVVLGKSQAYVWRRVMGKVPFDLAELEKIAAALGVPIETFLPRERAA